MHLRSHSQKQIDKQEKQTFQQLPYRQQIMTLVDEQYSEYSNPSILISIFKDQKEQLQARVIVLQTNDQFWFYIGKYLFKKGSLMLHHFSSYIDREELFFHNLDVKFSQDMKNASLQIKEESIEAYKKIQGAQSLQKKMNELDEIAQKAILAFQIYHYIANIKKETFYVDEFTSIKERIINHIQRKYRMFNTNCIEQLIECFTQGVNYDQSLFNQERFIKGRQQNKIIYFPTFVTQEIFNTIFQLKKSNQLVTYIYGRTGSGKSFGFSFYHYLYRFIDEYLMKYQLRTIHNFVDINLALKIPKMIYFSISKNTTVASFKSKIIDQIHPAIISQINPEKMMLGDFIQQIKLHYQKKGIQIFFLVDQINVYFSILRKIVQNKHQSGQKKNLRMDIQSILDSLEESHVVFSSSLNKETLYDLRFKQLRIADIFKKQNQQFHLKWPQNCMRLYGFFDTFNYILFQTKRQLSIFDKNAKKEKVREKLKQIASIWDQNNLKIISKQINIKEVSFPLTSLNIRRYLSEDKKFLKKIKQYSLFSFNHQLQLCDIIHNYFKSIKQFSFKEIIAAYEEFVWKGPQEYIGRKITILYDILKHAKLILFAKSNSYQTKRFVIKPKEISKNFGENWNADKKLLFDALDKNLFNYTQSIDQIAVFLLPCDLIQILEKVIFNITPKSSAILLRLFDTNFQKNRSYQGELIDKCFARIISQCQFLMILDVKRFQIKNSKKTPVFFKDFMGMCRQKINQQKQQQKAKKQSSRSNNLMEQTTKRSRSLIRLTNKESSSQQEKSSTSKPQNEKKQKIITKEEANQIITQHFFEAIEKINSQNLSMNQWISAAPQSKQYFNNLKILSTNSPSFDSLLMKKLDKEIGYRMITFDLTVQVLKPWKIIQRISKVKSISDQLISIFKAASLKLDYNHIILTSSLVKTKFAQMKNMPQYYELKNCIVSVESFEQFEFHITTDHSIEILFFTSVLEFIKKEMKQKSYPKSKSKSKPKKNNK